MIRKNSLFILGAGASHELGLPLGNVLRPTIKQLCQRDRTYWGTPTALEFHLGGISAAAELLNVSTDDLERAQADIEQNIDAVESIDQLLSINAQNKTLSLVGRIAITKAISVAESDSALANTARHGEVPIFLKAAQAKSSYLQKLWTLLHDDHDGETIQSLFQDVAFINFNYDRSLEFFFFTRLRQLFGLSAEQAARIVSSMKVVRPYGSIGTWGHATDETQQILAYGDKLVGMKLVDAAQSVRVISDDRAGQSSPSVQDAKRLISSSNTIGFLGSAFHKANLRILKFDKRNEPMLGPYYNLSRRVFATAYGIDSLAAPHLKAALALTTNCEEHNVTLDTSKTAAQMCDVLAYVLQT